MKTTAEAEAYRKELLAAGVGLELRDLEALEKYSGPKDGVKKRGKKPDAPGDPIRRLVKNSRGNPSHEIHDVPVEDVILCGMFYDGKKVVLVLPPSKEAFDAVLDFLRYEAMRKSWFMADKIQSIADEIERLGRKVGILDQLEFKNGTTNVAVAELKNGVTYDVVRSGFKAPVIGAWAVHKAFESTKDHPVVSKKAVPATTPRSAAPGYRVTHTKLGRSAASGLTRKAARSLAKTLAGSSYPWGLLRSPGELESDAWRAATAFAHNEVMKARHKPEKTKNPTRQLALFRRSPGQNDE